jgi:hypothetical protein
VTRLTQYWHTAFEQIEKKGTQLPPAPESGVRIFTAGPPNRIHKAVEDDQGAGQPVLSKSRNFLMASALFFSEATSNSTLYCNSLPFLSDIPYATAVILLRLNVDKFLWDYFRSLTRTRNPWFEKLFQFSAWASAGRECESY